MSPPRSLDLFQSLHIVNTGNLSNTPNNVFQVLQVGNIQNDIDVSVPIGGVGFNVTNVGAAVADDRRDLLQHAKTIVAIHGQLYGIGTRRPIVDCPFDINLALRFIQQVSDIRTVLRMHGHAFAASHVTDNTFTTNRIAALGPIHQQVTVALHADGIGAVIASEHAPHNAHEPVVDICFRYLL